jgi:hypothetical protein
MGQLHTVDRLPTPAQLPPEISPRYVGVSLTSEQPMTVDRNLWNPPVSIELIN